MIFKQIQALDIGNDLFLVLCYWYNFFKASCFTFVALATAVGYARQSPRAHRSQRTRHHTTPN